MRVAIVHDDLVQWGGAERVLSGICEIFQDAPIYTSVFDSTNPLLLQNFGTKKVITSFLQKIPGWRSLYKTLLPLYPIAFEQFNFDQFDLVISQTTRFAKSIITKPHTKHICYCHTPPRFLWNLSGEKVLSFFNGFLSYQRIFDSISSNRVDQFLAGSKNCKQRIKKIYRVDPDILLPFVDTERLSKINSFDGGYFLIIARLNNYKRVDIALEAFRNLPLKLKIVGVGPKMEELQKKSSENIEFLGNVSEELLLNLLSGCKALIITSEEDFGLTALEAQALGKPVLAYGSGGALETIYAGKTGVLFEFQTAESLLKALEKFHSLRIKSEDCIIWAGQFSKQNFKQKLLKCIM